MLEEQEEKKLIKLIGGILKLDVSVLSNLDDYSDIINNDELINIIDLFNIPTESLKEIVSILQIYKSEEKKLEGQEKNIRKLEENFQTLICEIPLEQNELIKDVGYLLECMANEIKKKDKLIEEMDNIETDKESENEVIDNGYYVTNELLKLEIDKKEELWDDKLIILKVLNDIETDNILTVSNKEQLIKDITSKVCQKLDLPVGHQSSNKRPYKEDRLYYEPLSKMAKTDSHTPHQSPSQQPGPSSL